MHDPESPKVEEWKSAEELRIFQEHPDLLDNPDILTSILLPIETWCLARTLLFRIPISTNEIHNDLVLELWRRMKETENRESPLDFKKKLPFLAYILPPSDGLTQIRKELNQEKREKQWGVEWDNTRKPTSDELKEMKAHLMEAGYKLPSYRVVDKTMNSLEAWNFITRRYDDERRAKHYWIISPAIGAEARKTLSNYLHWEQYRALEHLRKR